MSGTKHKQEGLKMAEKFNCIFGDGSCLEVDHKIYMGLDISIESEIPDNSGTVILSSDDVIKLRDHLNDIIDKEDLE